MTNANCAHIDNFSRLYLIFSVIFLCFIERNRIYESSSQRMCTFHTFQVDFGSACNDSSKTILNVVNVLDFFMILFVFILSIFFPFHLSIHFRCLLYHRLHFCFHFADRRIRKV